MFWTGLDCYSDLENVAAFIKIKNTDLFNSTLLLLRLLPAKHNIKTAKAVWTKAMKHC